MKLTIIRTERNQKRRLSMRTLENFIERIQIDNAEEEVTRMRRDLIFYHEDDRVAERLKAVPRIYPAAEMTKDADDTIRFKQMNGVVLLSVGNLQGPDELQLVKKTAQMMPSTLAAFIGISGRSVKILVHVQPMDTALPVDEASANRFYQDAYALAARIYDPILPYPLTRIGKENLTPMKAGFRMPLDKEPLLNTNAMPLLVPDSALVARLCTSHVMPSIAVDDDNTEKTPGQETRQLILFLQKDYRFRFNSVMGYTEYSRNNGYDTGWLPVDERMQNRLAVEARLSGLDVWDKDVTRYLKSGIIREYNPIHEYLWRVKGSWDGKDHIGKLAACVPTDNPHWPKWFRTWLLAMVAQWLGKSRQYGNSVAPLLISRQGYNKSTFCKSLIPNELQWGYNDNLQMNEKKSVLQAMCQFLLINLDEFNAISPKIQEGFLKNVIQLASVKVKRPYGKHVEDFPRLASFIATANMTDILADPSGSRRFIGIELNGPIRTNVHIDHDQLYAQILDALDDNEPYWFDQEQTDLIMESNRQFQRMSPVEQYFHECFEIPMGEEEGEYMTSAAIFDVVKQKAGSSLRLSTLNHFGRTLTNMPDIQRRRSSKGTEDLVKKR